MMQYIEKPKDSSRKLLEFIKKFGMFCISIHQQQTIREIKKTIPFTMTPKRIKYQGINLMKE